MIHRRVDEDDLVGTRLFARQLLKAAEHEPVALTVQDRMPWRHAMVVGVNATDFPQDARRGFAAALHVDGLLSLAEAAHHARTTVVDFIEYLSSRGYEIGIVRKPLPAHLAETLKEQDEAEDGLLRELRGKNADGKAP